MPTAEAEEIEEAIAMLREAGAQEHAMANDDLGLMLLEERKDVDGAEQAFRAAIGAGPGYADAPAPQSRRPAAYRAEGRGWRGAGIPSGDRGEPGFAETMSTTSASC